MFSLATNEYTVVLPLGPETRSHEYPTRVTVAIGVLPVVGLGPAQPDAPSQTTIFKALVPPFCGREPEVVESQCLQNMHR